jgi:type I restriction enzyme R subunit
VNANLSLRLFDPAAEFHIAQRRLPHWTQPGAIAFITWRTNDSMPKAVVEQWLNDRFCWLQQHEINPIDANWRDELDRLPRATVRQFYETFDNR